MSDTTTPKPTVASAFELAQAAKEQADLAIGVTGEQAGQITKVTSEQVALAQAFSLVREKVEKFATSLDATVLNSKLDGMLARIESAEKNGGGDWGPMIEAVDERVTSLATAVGSLVERPEGEVESVGSLVERVNYLYGQDVAAADIFLKMGNQLAELDRQVRQLGESAITVAEEQYLEAPVSNTASLKVLEVMRMVDVIGKDKDFTSPQARFKFRGVDQAMDAVGHAMRQVGLTLETRVLDRQMTQDSVVKKGNNGDYTQLWTTTVLTVQYAFVDPYTGHRHAFEMVGEGRDLSDKSTSKSAAMALKYGLFQGLMIPVEGFNDTDSDSERPVVERPDFPRTTGTTSDPPSGNRGGNDSPGRQVSQGRMTPAQAVDAYTQRGYQGDAAGPEDPAIGRPANAAPVAPEENLPQRAAFAARHLIEIQREPAAIALPAIQKAKARIEELGIGEFQVSLAADGSDRATLNSLVAAALQSASASVNRTAGTQGITREGQQAGLGAQAAVPADEYDGSEQQYLDALKALAAPDAPDDVLANADVIVQRWEARFR